MRLRDQPLWPLSRISSMSTGGQARLHHPKAGPCLGLYPGDTLLFLPPVFFLFASFFASRSGVRLMATCGGGPGKKRLLWRTALPVQGTQPSTTGILQSPGWNLWMGFHDPVEQPQHGAHSQGSKISCRLRIKTRLHTRYWVPQPIRSSSLCHSRSTPWRIFKSSFQASYYSSQVSAHVSWGVLWRVDRYDIGRMHSSLVVNCELCREERTRVKLELWRNYLLVCISKLMNKSNKKNKSVWGVSTCAVMH